MGPIIVPLDESALAEEAIPWAAMFARATAQAVQLVTVQPPADAFWEFADVDPGGPIFEHRETLSAYLEQVRRLDALGNIAVSTEVLDGAIVPQINWLAEQIGAGLAVITTRGQGGFSRGRIGSVAFRLVRSMRVPVVVVPPGAAFAPIEAVLVPVDGSEGSTRALETARALAHGLGAAVHLLCVVDPGVAWRLSDEERAPLVRRMLDRAREYLLPLAQPDEVAAAREGRPADAILDYAEENGCRLIAMATHGRSAEPPLEFGSTADELLHSSDRPVLLTMVHTQAARE